jgi:signal transduction histidine kinase/CheY-like chemotaxis protein
VTLEQPTSEALTIAILAPAGRDAEVIARILVSADLRAQVLGGADELMAALGGDDAGALIVTEEALGPEVAQRLDDWLIAQPPWSDLPVLLLSQRGHGDAHQARGTARLGNVTILERPFHPRTLVWAARSALRARARQHQAGRHIAELDRRGAALAASERRLGELNATLEQRVGAALAERSLLATLVQAADTQVQAADLDLRLLAINPAAADAWQKMFGTRPAVGDHLAALPMPPAQRAVLLTAWRRALKGEEFTEVLELGEGDAARHLEMRFSLLRDAAGLPIGATQFAADVTQRLRDQARLAEADARLHEMAKVETLGQLTGGVAHDFNNLLTPIVGALDLLRRRHGEDDRSLRLIGSAMQGAERASLLVQRLLSFARRQHLAPRVIDVGLLVEGLRDLLQRSIGPHITVRLNVASGLPPARIDPNQLELALLNLVINARDALGDGGTVTVTLREHDGKGTGALAPGRYLALAVHDTGRGMDEATLRRAIDPFFTTKEQGKGTGLGLSMVHGLAAQSGGALLLESRPGAGTTATICLPVADGGPEVALAPEPVVAQPRQARILLVDDDALVRRAVTDMLRSLGHDVAAVESGAAALAFLRKGGLADLLVTDHMMPGMRGTALIAAARALRPGLGALLVTGYADTAEPAPGAEEGFARLAKPFRESDLAQMLAQLLAGNGS